VEKIAAVVVTYNRKQLLWGCIDGLLAQSRVLDKIYIVDNASNDGTDSDMATLGYLSHDVITYVRLSSNTGGAGGFNEGMRIAVEAGFDWVWLMDDDVAPVSDGLETLLKYKNISECIHGRRVECDGTMNVWGDDLVFPQVKTIPIKNQNFEDREEYLEVSTGCFEGMLISSRLINIIGLPRPDYFIAMDDTYYGYLASKLTKVLYVNKVVLHRKKMPAQIGAGKNKRLLAGNLYLEYFHRNRFLVARSEGCVGFQFYLHTMKILISGVARELIKVGSFERAQLIVRGVLKGLFYERA
jgi:rhamnopyranosyl-N-acetylglucosaminyl-diphospho-decaprenol beta-1,3/1,4-galactofuranosyltransferase